MENLIIVGCGDHFRTNVGPSLASLEAAEIAKVMATVDLQPMTEKPEFLRDPVPHIIRSQGESLSRSLRQFREADPVVVLAHAHDCHATDALDLVSDGFRVIVEKPYALRASDLSLIRDAIRHTPQRLALAEYYLMMKSAPLLHAAGLLKPDSFYRREPGYLERVDGNSSAMEGLVGVLDTIGRPRMVYVDLLEGQDETGRFEHRGRQFADARVGIGVILDLAIHSLAPIAALEGMLGSLPPTSNVSLNTATCDSFIRSAASKYDVPTQFVPETYAEMAFTTSLGIPVVVTVGKYVLRNENQRRLLIVGDEGEALLDMSNCILSIAQRDKCPAIVLRAPKRSETKYVAVFRACLLALKGETPYNFDASDVALRSNEFTLELHSRACEQGPNRRQYPSGAAPGTILQIPANFEVQPKPAAPVLDHEGAKLYYEHQYERLAAVEDQGFKMSGGVLILTGAVFTFASRASTESFLQWRLIVFLMGFANFLAIVYMWRVDVTIHGHQDRAKEVLKRTWRDLYDLDKSDKFRIKWDKLQMRTWLLRILHGAVLAAAIRVLDWTLKVHVAISVIGIASGLVVMFGLLYSKRLDRLTKLFLTSTVLTSVTGFLFPVDHLLLSHMIGTISLVVLAVAILARYRFHLAGGWCRSYVVGAAFALYLNVFVLIVQSFQKMASLKAMSPTQREAPFLVAQFVVLAFFVALALGAAKRFRVEPASAAAKAA